MTTTPRTPTSPAAARIDGARFGLPPRDDLVGAVIRHKYRVDAHIGQGGLSDVYEVLYLPGACRQAIKVLRSDASAEDTRRFEHEYRTLLHLDHPGLVRVFDYDVTATGRPFFSMELLRGRSLERAFDLGERVRPARVVRIALQVCSALAALHRQRIIHRDIKPGNIMLLDRADDDRRERVKVVDLGIARLTTGYYEAAGNVLELTPRSQRLRTSPGFILGTPGYIAPEYASGQLDARQDMYAVGVTIYRLLTGKRAFPTGDPDHLPISEYLPDVPGPLVELVERALAREPDGRFDSIEEMHAALERALELLTSTHERDPTEGKPPSRRWPWMLGCYLLGVATMVPFIGAPVADADSHTTEPLPRDDEPTARVPTKAEPVQPAQPGPTKPSVTKVEAALVDDEPSAPQASPVTRPHAKRTKTKPSPRRVFARAIVAAEPSVAVCLDGVTVTADAPLTLRVRVDAGRAADITRVGPPLPALVDECLRRAVTTIEFPSTLSGTFTHRFTP